MRVACDIDNVICDILSSARRALSADLGVPVAEIAETGIYYAPFSHPGTDAGRPIRLQHSFWSRRDVLEGAPPLPGAVAAMNRLHAAGMLAGYVTRRPDADRPVTAEWMSVHGFPSVPLRLVGTTDPMTTFAACKSSVCRDLGASHLIDDHADEVATAHSAGVSVIVVDAFIGRARRHEMLARHPHVPLAQDVAHAVDIIMDLARKAA